MNDEEVMDREEEQMDKEATRRMQEKKADLGAKRRMQKQGSKPKNNNGRPPNSGSPQQKKRETKPKGMAWVREYEIAKAKAFKCISEIETVFTKEILTSKNKKYKKSLSKNDRKGIEDISFAVASHYDLDVPVTFDNAKNIFASTDYIRDKVLDFYILMMEHTNVSTVDERRRMMATSIANNYMEINYADR